jgi:hypothetical protein
VGPVASLDSPTVESDEHIGQKKQTRNKLLVSLGMIKKAKQCLAVAQIHAVHVREAWPVTWKFSF